MNWKWVLVIVLMVILFIFALQNHEAMNIRFLLWSLHTSQAIVIFSSLITGVIVGMLLSLLRKK
ncbi:MAG: LapA family protein [Candidatus Omnitrophica bacterium]|nr:LapA family protein [Candidatus Omnitrophota bacterium]MBU4477793.1 LapA family protein [Candidatus Omnitrophota bacterium]MCG2704096.1 LapA family protein [Candidatus Omnitrophota bacterium]